MYHLHLQYSDLLFFTVVIIALADGIRSLASRSRRLVWVVLLSSPVAMASFVVLIFYIIITALDCIHFYNPNNHMGYYSLLDRMFYQLASQNETTYSAPFATHLLTKSSVMKGGAIVRTYLPLKHIHSTAYLWLHLVSFIVISSAIVLGCISAILKAISSIGRKPFGLMLRNICKGKSEIAWRTCIITFWLIVTLFGAIVYLSHFYHVMGTDKVGRDVFYLTIKSIRTGVLIGSLTTIIMLPFALLLGCVAGYFKGFVDELVVYVYTTISSIPGVLLIGAVLLASQALMAAHPGWFATIEDRADVRLLVLCGILGLTSWTSLCRLLRAEALKLRNMDFILAAKVMRVSTWRIIVRHLIPNVMYIVLIAIVLDFSGLVLAEAVLSYVGVGVDPTMASWGNMINAARMELARYPVVWWPLVSAVVAMFGLVLPVNLLANRVQIALDNRQGRQ